MAFGFSSSVLLFLFIVLNLARAKLILEDGYEVTTVVDGHKLGLNPHTVHALPGSSNLIVLDSSSSTFFTTSFPLSFDSVINRFAGDGNPGYLDGKGGNSRFDKPRGFAVDAKGNVYVADKNNKAIRKISSSGYVTTIAGGISKAYGHRDGPAQNATFSNNFEITFVPQRCCLLVSDHGNEMIRQINLKEEDCLESSHSNLGSYSLWSIGIVVLSCFLGVVIGFVVRPYIIRHEEVNHLSLIMTWKLLLIKLGEQVLTFFSSIRNLLGGSTVYSVLSRLVMMVVSHLSLMYSALSRLVSLMVSRIFFMCQPNNVPMIDKSVSFTPDSQSHCNSKQPLSLKPSDDLMDLISFDDAQETNNGEECTDQETDTSLSLPHATIDDLINVQLEGFSKMAEENSTTHGSSSGK